MKTSFITKALLAALLLIGSTSSSWTAESASPALQGFPLGEIRLVDGDGNRYLVRVRYRGRRTGLDRTELQVEVEARALVNNPRVSDLLQTSLSIFVGETVVVGSSVAGAADSPVIVLVLSARD